jgi:hypothetical protein
MKVCQDELAIFYIDNETTFHHDVFYDFKVLEACQHDVIPLCWVSNPFRFEHWRSQIFVVWVHYPQYMNSTSKPCDKQDYSYNT